MHLERAEEAIKQAWIAGTVVAVFTIFIAVMVMAASGGSVWGFADVALLLGLSVGVYKKSRTAAVVLLLYYVGGKAWIVVQGDVSPALAVSIIFAYFFFQGVRGTFAYHREMKAYAQ
jgi:hypothetical protein